MWSLFTARPIIRLDPHNDYGQIDQDRKGKSSIFSRRTDIENPQLTERSKIKRRTMERRKKVYLAQKAA